MEQTKDRLIALFSGQKEASAPLHGDWNLSDCMCMPGRSDCKQLRKGFGIADLDEVILFFRDTSWLDYNRGLVMTDRALYLRPDKEDRSQDRTFDWRMLSRASLEGNDTVRLWNHADEPVATLPHRFFLKSSAARIAQVVELLNEAIGLTSAHTDQAIDTFQQDFDQIGDHTGKLTFASKAIASMPGNTLERAFAGYHAGLYCLGAEDYSNALQFFSEALQNDSIEEGSVIYGDICGEMGACLANLDNLQQSRQYALMGALFADNEQHIDDDDGMGTTLRARCTALFRELDQAYVEHFAELPYKERQKLMIVDSYRSLFQEHYATLCKDNLPPQLVFPVGHPVENTLYVAHPTATHRYLPIEDYEVELVEDQLREYCHLLQALGATSITISTLQQQEARSTDAHGQTLGGSAAVRGVGAGATQSKDYSQQVIDTIARSLSLHQSFQPHQPPHLPEGLVWYDSQPSWQRLAHQRMEGSLLHHEERIETLKSRLLDNQEMTALRAEVFAHFLSVGLNVGHYEESLFEQHDNVVLTVQAQFAPVDTLRSAAHSPAAGPAPTHSEQAYLQEVVGLLAFGPIEDLERMLLSALREKLGISEARAQELEQQAATNPLTDDEQRYADMLLYALQSGPLGERQRRLLDRMCQLLAISPDRARLIERMHSPTPPGQHT